MAKTASSKTASSEIASFKTTFSKAALFAFGLAAVLVAGSVTADAAMRVRGSAVHDSYASGGTPGPTVGSEESLFDRAKGSIY
ncbi:hypothetical protein PQJ75_09660 [Rhodoplanes sp. TEM]|uniref:Uncharacterized protein n=1 Tax=Rhodoplanes tepidamans TaxID=200616 RepID=A0ABT5J5W7_RHOTP|nr:MULTISPECIES: hypothetical protein [Rhodoplanes]MDC7784908.1 hypothetical protein [Rhodoplanes tepidamans]MDC7983996.1 hypothetical protein [Rhodoplanes sp. TEM]MDQ0353863.1 hypothetical protein [Rhodoplanes tepidamans]